MEIVDGEMEILAAGDWRDFPERRAALHGPCNAAACLPSGHFQLTKTGKHLWLEWTSDNRRGIGPGHSPRSRSNENTLIHATCWHFGRVSLDRVPGIHWRVRHPCSASDTGRFYVCWDYSKALHYATDDINAALHRRGTLAGGHSQRHGKNHRRDHRRRRTVCGFPAGPTKSFTVSMPVKSAAKWRHRIFRSRCCRRSRHRKW